MEWNTQTQMPKGDLSSASFRKALGERFRQVRIAKSKAAEVVAKNVGIDEFHLALIESGLYEHLTMATVDKIAVELGITNKAILAEPIKDVNSMKKKMGKAPMPNREKEERMRDAKRIRERRLALGLTQTKLEQLAKLPENCIAAIEAKGVGLFAERAKLIFQILDKYETEGNKLFDKNINGLNGHEPMKKPRQSFVISTELKLKCEPYELTASIYGGEFNLTIESDKDAVILEGAIADKHGVLAALKTMIQTIEGK